MAKYFPFPTALGEKIESVRAGLDSLARKVNGLPKLKFILCRYSEQIHNIRAEIEKGYIENARLAGALEEVEAERAWYKELFESIPDIYIVTDAQGGIIEVNPVAARVLSVEGDNLVGEKLKEFIAEEDMVSYGALMDELERKAEIAGQTIRFKSNSGLYFPALVHAGCACGHNGALRINWLIADITDQIIMEEALYQAEDRYGDLFNGVPIGLFRSTTDGEILDLNRAMIKILGYPDKGALLRVNYSDLYADKSNHQTWLAALNSDDVIEGFETWFRRFGGEIVWVRNSARAIRDGDGKIIYFEGSIEDITAQKGAQEVLQRSHDELESFVRKRTAQLDMRNKLLKKEIKERRAAQKQLAKERARLQTMIDNAPEGIIVVNENSQINFVNPVAEQICKRPIPCGESISSLKDLQFCNPDGSICEPGEIPLIRSVVSGEVFANREMIAVLPDGEKRNLLLNTAPIRDEAGKITGAIAIFLDITAIKQAEADKQRLLHRLRDYARELQKKHKKVLEQSEILRSLAIHLETIREDERTIIARELHDELGQILSGLKMDLSWMVSRIPKEEKILLEKANYMLKYIDPTVQMIRRISSELRPGILDDLGLIAALEWQLQEFQKRTGIQTDISIMGLRDHDLDPAVATVLFRVFQESLTNIMRHSEASRVEIILKVQNGNLLLCIADNGRGIRDSEVASKKSLGLLGMRERLMPHGGEFEIHGSPEKGTIIKIRIPLLNNRDPK